MPDDATGTMAEGNVTPSTEVETPVAEGVETEQQPEQSTQDPDAEYAELLERFDSLDDETIDRLKSKSKKLEWLEARTRKSERDSAEAETQRRLQEAERTTQQRLQEASQQWANSEGYVTDLANLVSEALAAESTPSRDKVREVASRMQSVASGAADQRFARALARALERPLPKGYQLPDSLENKLLKAKDWDGWADVKVEILMDAHKDKYIEQGEKRAVERQKAAEEVKRKQEAGQQRQERQSGSQVNGTASGGAFSDLEAAEAALREGKISVSQLRELRRTLTYSRGR